MRKTDHTSSTAIARPTEYAAGTETDDEEPLI